MNTELFSMHMKKKKPEETARWNLNRSSLRPSREYASICLGTSHPRAGSSRLYLPNRFADDRERTTGPWSRKKSMEYL